MLIRYHSEWMAVITVSGEPGCRSGEVAGLIAQSCGFQRISAGRLDAMLEEEFGPAASFPEKAWPAMAASILLRHSTDSDLVVGVDGAENLFRNYPGLLRIRIVAPRNRRIGNVMLDDGLDRPAARQQLKIRERAAGVTRKARFGRAMAAPDSFDLVLNAESMDGGHLAQIAASAVEVRSLRQYGLLSKAAEAQQQFQLRLQLSKEGIHPKGRADFRRAQFSHPSEEIFANLLDFYRIEWEYEPKSFPVAWDEQGRVLESFTPDFYLPESNRYVELTTMKQSLVTKKNRKIRLLREIYPQVQIQVFYQKDLQDLIFKYGLVEQKAE
ncbi:MAG TPA: cytidylate kinase family protein [Bryobacteraceae bacterium]|nr:cytidylate kinase family protein [Bryobacteraceae bacterium]